MHIETLTIDRVFDIQRQVATRYAHRQTDFSFESAGVKHYAVQAPGWPNISPGDRLTFVLEKAGNWQTVAGWKNHSTSEMVLPETGQSLVGIWTSACMMGLGYVMFAMSTTQGARVASSALMAFLAWFLVSLVRQWRRQKALALAIQQAQDTGHVTS